MTAETEPSKPRIGPAMKRVLAYLAQQHAPVTCAAVYAAAGLDTTHLSTRMPLWRCESLGLVHVDRYRCNRYQVTITEAGREYVTSGRAAIVSRPTWDDAMRWQPSDDILDRIDAVLSQE
jgi:hypothetical protein